MGEKPGQGRKEAWQGESLRTRMKRVKVYRLEDNGKWDDQGTGHVTIDYIEGSKDLALAVVDEEDNDTLLLHNITPDDIYRKQEETIISWRDPEKALELALSFQEAESCSFIWENMCTIQLELQSKILGSHEVRPQRTVKSLEAPRDSLSRGKSLAFELPPLELSSLSVILKTILLCDVTQQTRLADLILKDRDFFPKIVDLFRTCKGLGDMDGLHKIFRLVKAIILLNSAAIFDKIFSDDFILDIIGVLEYDPEDRNVQNHSAFLKEHAVFKEAIPIRNASVVSKIHQTYRICYIKDVILPKGLDEATLASLNAIINANNAFVVCLLKDDTSFMQRLFATMRSSNISAESKRELVLFLREFCTVSSSLQPAQRMQLSRDLASRGVFDIISDVLRSQEKVLVSAGTDILHYLTQDPNLLRSYIANHEESSREGISLLGLLIEGIATDFGGEMLCQFLEILKVLLDGCTADTVTQCRDFIELFYEKCFDKLINIIESSRVEEYSAKLEILYNICELLCFCARHHPYKIKITFFGSNSMEKILTLTRRRERSLVVAAVRIMRTIIGACRNDELLISHVIEFNTLKPIIEVFVENGNRYNMLHSMVLELLDFIRKENLKSLVVYVVESFWDQLLMFEQLTSIQAFKLKYQEYVDIAEETQTTSVDHTRKADERGLDKEEEDYFSKDSNEEDSAAQTRHAHQQCLVKPANGSEIHHIPARPKSGGLVDNDSDKDYKPSPKRPVKADEALNIPMASPSSLDSKDADGNILKKPKLEDNQSPLSPASSIKNSDGNDDVGKASPGSPDQQQHALESLDSGHQTGDDCMKDAEDTTKTTDSEPSTAG
ncbi:unnamed protein product [Triticum turgidum subsp. durum]|uniref:Serine/threonine-protein phosphatase 4 regulatory subunit 3-like central domain-containing protein n=3 Tax=Triticinae TaxID=1648030 RepID=A0A9R0UTX2_TRITD|nr:unnamed protein product [Triticum turgidum subsp. durum]